VSAAAPSAAVRGSTRIARVRVPATSANVGPGFDALGLALSLYNRFEAEESEGLAFTGCDEAFRGPDNLFVVAYRRALDELGLPFRGLRARFEADIPVTRGLGSSSACIVGGIMAANALFGGGMDRGAVLDLAAVIEGHPDNVTPAVLGGFAVAVIEERHVHAIRCAMGEGLVFNALVPPFELETSKARAALPRELPFKDAVFNVGRAALAAAAFASKDYEALGVACRDRLHEDYRAPLIPGFREVVRAARGAGALAVFLSGAGPTVMAICRSEDSGFSAAIDGVLAEREGGPWHRLTLRADDEGAVLEGS
jgi:homoserine kinase